MKNRIKRILCPIDFGTASANAMEYAAKLSKELDASLTLWNMCELPIMDQIATQTNLPNSIGKKQKELSEILQDWCEEIKEEHDIACGYFVSSSIESLEKTLAHYTDGENFDLMVIGTNGIDDMYQLFFGTNSYRIFKEVRCPVMVIPVGYIFKKMKSVVFATDYYLSDAKLANGLVQTFNASITFLHLSKKGHKNSEEEFQAMKELFEKEIGDNYLVDFEHLITSNKLDGLVEKMIEKKADLVILSTKKRNSFEDLFHKSFTKKVLDGIQIPALVFHQNENKRIDFPIH